MNMGIPLFSIEYELLIIISLHRVLKSRAQGCQKSQMVFITLAMKWVVIPNKIQVILDRYKGKKIIEFKRQNFLFTQRPSVGRPIWTCWLERKHLKIQFIKRREICTGNKQKQTALTWLWNQSKLSHKEAQCSQTRHCCFIEKKGNLLNWFVTETWVGVGLNIDRAMSR